jgi:hypothetical protein
VPEATSSFTRKTSSSIASRSIGPIFTEVVRQMPFAHPGCRAETIAQLWFSPEIGIPDVTQRQSVPLEFVRCVNELRFSFRVHEVLASFDPSIPAAKGWLRMCHCKLNQKTAGTPRAKI